MTIVFGTDALANVTEYDVRCEIALSRAWRMAAIVVLYALLTCCWFITGTRMMMAKVPTVRLMASTDMISSKLKPLEEQCRFPKLFVSRMWWRLFFDM